VHRAPETHQGVGEALSVLDRLERHLVGLGAAAPVESFGEGLHAHLSV
jgi:hypothetical protein